MSFTDPELVQSESFDMDRQQMYKESRIQDFMWTDERGMLVYNNSLSHRHHFTYFSLFTVGALLHSYNSNNVQCP